MSQLIIDELKVFLKSANLSNYEINAYITLSISNPLKAREISERSDIPIGRIYDILEKLKEKGLIENQEVRPKMYKSLPFSFAFQTLIDQVSNENQQKISVLYEKARKIESKIFNSNLSMNKQISKTFCSIEYDRNSILSLYISNVKELKEELLTMSFLNEEILNFISIGENYFLEILEAMNRGVQVKYLWTLKPGINPFTSNLTNKNQKIYHKIEKIINDKYNLSIDIKGFDMKYVPKIIPTQFSIFDKKRVIFKIHNPFRTSEILFALNLLDPNLAMKLREIYLNIWFFDVTD